jgi:hypothetical protein
LQIIVRSFRDLGKDGQKIFDAQWPTIRGNSKCTDFQITLTVDQHQEALAARDYTFRHPFCSHSHLLGKSSPISAAAASSAFCDRQRSVALSAGRPYQRLQSSFTSSGDTTSTSSAQVGRHESRPVHSQHVSDDPQTPDWETSKNSGAAAWTADPKEHADAGDTKAFLCTSLLLTLTVLVFQENLVNAGGSYDALSIRDGFKALSRCAPGATNILEQEDDSEAGRSQEQDENAMEGACERMVLEVVRMLQDGKVEQAEFFLLEGAADPIFCPSRKKLSHHLQPQHNLHVIIITDAATI